MDEVESAIVSVSEHVAVGTDAEKWFEAVCSAHEDFGENWSLFKDALTTRAYEALGNAEITETFVRFMEEQAGDKTGVLTAMQDRRNDLPQVYATLVAEEQQALAQAGGAPPAPKRTWGEHTAAWYEHLTTGKQWAGWSGADGDWDEFAKWFRYYAEVEGATAEAENFLTTVAASSNKVSALADFGITVGTAAKAPKAATDNWSHWTPAEWYDYLTTLPTDPCPTWNGLDGEHWDYFKYWFVVKATAEGGPGAQAFVDEIDKAPDKVVALRRYGITVYDPNGIPVAPKPPAAPKAKANANGWVEFLTKNIGRYKGNSSWNFYRSWLLAETRGKEFAKQAEAFLARADGMRDKDVAFTELGITLAARPAPAKPEAKPAAKPAAKPEAKPEAKPAAKQSPAEVTKQIEQTVLREVVGKTELKDQLSGEQWNGLIAERLRERAAARR